MGARTLMPVLGNPRHERFAQELAKGTTAIEAHRLAGYSPDRSSAWRLQHNASIAQRVGEILAAREHASAKATERAIEKAAVDKAWVMTKLRENAERALQSQPVFDSDGNPVGEYRYEGSVANRALELLGKEIGMFIERRESGRPGEFATEMTEEELATIARRGSNGIAVADAGSEKPSKLH